ncbi:TPA: hypothetical protein ACH3X3_001393 [Trebouxia sp. C0006]
MHEATLRLLGMLLHHLDGFETNKRSVVIAATNRKEDLDSALLSRFNTSVQFGLPDESCRAQILHQYAMHLSDQEVASVAAASAGMAGRNLKDLRDRPSVAGHPRSSGRCLSQVNCLLLLSILLPPISASRREKPNRDAHSCPLQCRDSICNQICTR